MSVPMKPFSWLGRFFGFPKEDIGRSGRSSRYVDIVTVDESVREDERSNDEEKDENVKGDICQLLDQRTASQRRDKSCAPSH